MNQRKELSQPRDSIRDKFLWLLSFSERKWRPAAGSFVTLLSGKKWASSLPQNPAQAKSWKAEKLSELQTLQLLVGRELEECSWYAHRTSLQFRVLDALVDHNHNGLLWFQPHTALRVFDWMKSWTDGFGHLGFVLRCEQTQTLRLPNRRLCGSANQYRFAVSAFTASWYCAETA